MKKWREKGGRLIERGENPHSNGLWRFLSFKIFKDRKKPKKNKKNEIKTLKIILKNKIFIKQKDLTELNRLLERLEVP